MATRDGGIATGSTRVPGRIWQGRRAIAISLAVLVLLIPVALAAFTPSFAAPPRSSVWSPPPLPAPSPGARPTLDGIVDPLPIVVRDLPDEGSRLAVQEWDAASFSDPSGALAMLEHAWGSLEYDVDGVDALLAYGEYLIFGSSGRGPRDLASGEPSPEALAAMAALTHDPRNADRLNNVAVALFALGAGNDALYLDEVEVAAG